MVKGKKRKKIQKLPLQSATQGDPFMQRPANPDTEGRSSTITGSLRGKLWT
jgi:hypothetical protein